MNKEQLRHIFDNSACLSPRQLRSYASGKMVHEEAHAVEMHLLSCPFCHDALEGVKEQIPNGSLDEVENIDSTFLQKHFGISNPDVELNNVATPAKTEKLAKKVETIANRPALLRNLGIAASVLILVGILWFMRDSIFTTQNNEQLAQNTEPRDITPPAATTTPMEVTQTEEEQSTPAENDVATIEEASKGEVSDEVKNETIASERIAAIPEKPMKEPEKVQEEKTNLAAAKPNLEEQKVAKKETVTKQEKAETTIASDNSYYDKRLGNSYNSDEVKPAAAIAAQPADEDVVPEPPANLQGIDKGDYLYKQGKYRDALKVYQEEMFDTKSSRRDLATLKAAQCHKNLGEKTQAKTLLNSLVRDNSPLKDQAQKSLEQMK